MDTTVEVILITVHSYQYLGNCELTYLKKYYSLYDQKISKSALSDLMKQDAEKQYNDAIQRISKNNPVR